MTPFSRLARLAVRPFAQSASLAVTGAFVLAALTPACASAQATTAPVDGGPYWATVQQALGGKGSMQPGGVLKFGFPRSDLRVTAAGVAIKPALALGSWIAFKRTGAAASSPAIAMGDLVLTEDEVAPVMQALQQGGVEQTALHNHLLHESPHVMYMHIMAHGDPAKIARAVRSALAASATPMPQLTTASMSEQPAMSSTPLDLDTTAIARALGASGRVSGGVYQVSVPRLGRVTEHGIEIPPSMGVATGINFQPTGGGRAVVTGDFVMIASEVSPVLRALRTNGIEVTALHNHMLTETPRLLFMHFWANDDATRLAARLGAALDQMAVKRTTNAGLRR